MQLVALRFYKNLGRQCQNLKGHTSILLGRTLDDSAVDVKKHRATDVVRVGGATYTTSHLQDAGILVTDLPFEDGTAPSMDVITRWCELLRSRRSKMVDGCIVIHCVAGLGRAPVMVALALIELGMKYEDAVEMIRMKRRGAINSRQLDFLARYRPRSRLSTKRSSKCLVM